MHRTFFTEDTRKTKLFNAWIKYLQDIHSRFTEDCFEEFYEGTATVLEISKSSLRLKLEDGRNLNDVPITPEISQHSLKSDMIFMYLGRRQDKWWPLDAMSIGSLINKREFHLTINPLLMAVPLPTNGLSKHSH